MRVALIVGHSLSDKGAVNNDKGLQEFDYNNPLVKLISGHLIDARIDHDILYRVTYQGLPAKINNTNADFAIEFHANAHNTKATGSEVLYWHSSSKSKRLAEVMNEATCRVLGLSDRGVEPISKGNGAHLLRGTRMPCVINEPFFIDNNSDLERALEKRDELAKSYADAIISYMR